MAHSVVKETRRIGRALAASVPGAFMALGNLEALIKEAQDAPPLDPLVEAGITQGLNQQIGSAIRTASAARARGTTTAVSATDILAARSTLSSGILARESGQTRRFLETQNRRTGLGQALAQLTSGGFRGGPTDALVQARAAIRVAEINAEAAKVLQSQGALFDFLGNIPGAAAAFF